MSGCSVIISSMLFGYAGESRYVLVFQVKESPVCVCILFINSHSTACECVCVWWEWVWVCGCDGMYSFWMPSLAELFDYTKI